MARPAKQLSAADVLDLAFSLEKKLNDYNFCYNHLVYTKNPDGTDLYPLQADAQEALEPICKSLLACKTYKSTIPVADEVIEQFRVWLAAFISPKGWTRILAARRQRAHVTSTQRGKVAGMEARTVLGYLVARDLAYFAEAAGLTRKEYMSKLVYWFKHHERGQKAFDAFSKTLPQKPTTKAAS